MSSGSAERLRIHVLVEDSVCYDVRGLSGQHGLSVLAEVRGGGGLVNYVLLDTGQSFSTLLRNALSLNLLPALSSLKAVVLSHNHYDHTGGLKGLIRYLTMRGAGRVNLKLYAHPYITMPSIVVRDGRAENVGLNVGIDEVRELGLNVVLTRDAVPIDGVDGAYFLGEVPRVRGPGPAVKGNYTIINYSLRPHPLIDDSAVAFVVKGYGTVVITGCSHSGILNIVEHALRVTGERVRAVVGGLHLVGADESLIKEVSRGLKELGVEELHVGHCTGFKAMCYLAREWGDGFRKLCAGYTASWGPPTLE